MIITCKKEVPFRWIAFTVLPWISFTFNGQTMNVAFLFSLKKFVENPAGLTFILSLPTFLSLLTVPIVNFLSDRIWTRFGRRKPFVVGAWMGTATTLILMPLMPNFWALLAVFLVYNIFNDVGGGQGPMEPLCQEIVPPHQRGRSTGLNQWLSNLTTMCFYFFALGRFDDVRFMAGVPIVGEKVIYWSAGLIVVTVFLFVTLGIKEMNQKSRFCGQRLTFKNFFGGVLDRELWPIFMLVFSVVMLNSSLGSLGNLLYTDQWNYTKQEMGINVVIGGIINMFIIVFLAMIADKLNRMRAYQVLICAALAVKAAYFGYINYILPDHRPSLVELVVFGETLSIIGMLTGMVYTPLVYDYITRNKMGTYMAGAGILGRITSLITLNGIGLFVWGYAALFQPPAGEMVHVVLRGESQQSDVRSLVRAATWTNPQNGTPLLPSQVHVKTWMANGMDLTSGRCWEIRLRDKNSEQLVAEKETIKNESSAVGVENKTRVKELAARTKSIDTELTARAANLQGQATRIFGDRVLTDGEQVMGAKMCDTLLVEFPTAERPNGPRLEKILTDLRQERPDVIDLRPIKYDAGYGLAVSVLFAPGTDEKRLALDLQTAVVRVSTKRDPKLFSTSATLPSFSHQSALAMDLMVVEEPLDWRVSPIMRVANGVLALFDNAPTPDRRLSAIARKLRMPGETDHVRVYPGPNDTKVISVITLLRPGAAKAETIDDPVGHRLQSLFTPPDPATLAQARAFYDRIETVAASKRITVARPFVTVAYAPMKYDYMAGYICMFTLGLVGLGLTFKFQKYERQGRIRKLGREEAAAL